MKKNDLDKKKSSPYYQLINFFKYYNLQKNNSSQNGKYSSITNNNQSLQNNINSIDTKIDIINNKSFYYYTPFPSLKSPIYISPLLNMSFPFPIKEEFSISPS